MPTRVPGEGPSRARIAIVGEAPGKDEVANGRPFVGAAGRLLRAALHRFDIRPSECWITNVVKYQPPRNHISAFFDQKSGLPNELVLEGITELREELEAVQPTVIIALGNTALWALTRGCAKWRPQRNQETQLAQGWSGIGDWRGSIIEGNGIAGGRKVVAAYHPANILRQWPNHVYLEHDLKRARAQSEFPDIRRPQRKIWIDPRGEDRLAFRDRLLDLAPGDMVATDTEILPGGNLISVSFCSKRDEAASIRIKNSSDLQFVRSIVESGAPLAFQNGMFDCAQLEYWFRMSVFEHFKYDTMLAAHAAYLELPKDLGTLNSLYTEQPCYWTHISWDAIKKGKQSIDDVVEYGGIDAWSTNEVRIGQTEQELTDPVIRKWYEHELALVPELWKMDKHGIIVDQEGLRKFRAELEANIERCNEITSNAAGYPVNVFSGPILKKYLIDDTGLKGVKLTKGGRVSLDDKALAEMSLNAKTPQQRARIAFVREERRDRSAISKFCDITFGKDGRFRSTHNAGGTNTGRLSAHAFDPTGEGDNGQNILKRARFLYKPDPGKVFGYSDYERAESWVVAQITGDPLMLAHHAPGADAHKLLAAELFSLDVSEVGKPQREIGKQTRHAGNYLQGAKTFMTNVNKREWETGVSITLGEARFFKNRYEELHIGLRPWWDSVRRRLFENDMTLFNLLGRRRTFYDRREDCLPEAVAFVPQSTVGDAMNIAFLRASKDEVLEHDLGFNLLLQVHDALGWQCFPQYVDQVIERLDSHMLIPVTNPRTFEEFTIPVEHAVGPSWGEVEKWHKSQAA